MCAGNEYNLSTDPEGIEMCLVCSKITEPLNSYRRLGEIDIPIVYFPFPEHVFKYALETASLLEKQGIDYHISPIGPEYYHDDQVSSIDICTDTFSIEFFKDHVHILYVHPWKTYEIKY